MINRIAIAAALGALAGELAINPLAAALIDVTPQPARLAVLALPVAIGVVFAGAGALFLPARVRLELQVNVDRSPQG